MPLHGRVSARKFRVMNGWCPYRPWAAPARAKPELHPAGQGPSGDGSFGEGRPPPTHPRPGISNPLDPLYRVPKGRSWWGSRRPSGLFGSLGNGPRLSALLRAPSSALGTVLAGLWPATPAAWSALLPPSATSPGRRVALSSTFLKHRKRACTWYGGPFCPDYGASGDGGGAAGKPVSARPCPGHGFRRNVHTRLDRAGGPRPIHPGGRRIRSLGRKKGTPSQIGAPGPGAGPRER